MKQVGIIAWIAVLVVGAIMGFRFLNDTQNPSNPSSDNGSFDGPGGPFTLTAHTGETVSDTDFRGRYMLIYFGYSYCPDVCPLELQKLTSSLLTLEAEGYDTSPLQPIFISVDPERDTPEALANYVTLFHESLIGLTGSPEDIAKIARDQFKIYYEKRASEDVDEYLMDHLSVIFMMGPDGGYRRIFTSRDKPENITAALKPLLQKTS
jgi:protein SCO1/2